MRLHSFYKAPLFMALIVTTSSAYARVYSVNNTTISDHGNPSIAGSIADALRQCAENGGGEVRVASGTYGVMNGLRLGRNCSLVGSGMDATTIRMESGYHDLVTVASGQNSVRANWVVKELTLEMSPISNRASITTVPLQANTGTISNVRTTGGSPYGWGIDLDGALIIHIDGYNYNGEGSGIRWHNDWGIPYNIGDSAIENTTVVIKNMGATGIKLLSPSNSTGVNRVNNILLSRVEVQTPDGIVRDGTVGIHMVNTARITLNNVDIEHMDTGILQESAVNGGAVATTNAFIQTYFIGCRRDYAEVGTPPVMQTVIGGQGALASTQQFPTSNIQADHNIMGRNRVFTAVRPIETHFNSSVDRTLTVADSGKIFTNRSATGPVTFVLPPANLSHSIEFEFHLATAGYPIRIVPAAGDLIRPGQTSSGKYFQSGTSWGQSLKIRNIDATTWSIISQQGQWASLP